MFSKKRKSEKGLSFTFLKQKGRGFTLIELLVVTAMIAILAALLLTNYRSGQRQLALDRAASKLAQDIRRAQEMAMAVKEEEGCLGHEDYKYGYGINFDKDDNKYILFADCNGNKKYKEETPDLDVPLFNPDFNKVAIDSFSGLGDRLDITFEPPDPFVYFYGPGELDVANVFIVLKVKNDPSKTKTITVNKAGLITIE